MVRKSIIPIFLILSSFTWAQRVDDSMVICKPLSEMAGLHRHLAKASARTDIGNWDVHYYDLEFDIDIDAKSILGATEVHLISNNTALSSIQLDLSSNLSVESVYSNASSYTHSANILNITLDRTYGLGESLSVGINYSGQPQVSGFQAMAFSTQDNVPNASPLISTLSEPYGARTWWPCKDAPTDKADSVRVSITVADHLTAVSNGLLKMETDNLDSTKTWIWEHKYPIATYLVSLAITEYDYWTETYHFADGDSMPLEYWMYPEYADNTNNILIWNQTPVMLDIFNERYGPYPFADEKYGMAQFSWGGAMEHQTCSSIGGYTNSSGAKTFSENTNAHELAHQWWGDLVTCSDFHHIWINEGFATYSEALYWGDRYGDAAYHAHMASKDYDYVGSIYRSDTTSVWSIFNGIVYGKGAWTLHMLRHVMGDASFFETLAQFREEFKFSHASTEDFQGVAESVYGESLLWFFDQWIYGSGKPNYSWWWSSEAGVGAGSSQINVHVDQIQSEAFPRFKMPIDLQFQGAGRDTTIVIWNTSETQTFQLQLDFEPSMMIFDPDNWIHKDVATFSGLDNQKLQPDQIYLLEAFPNPFNARTNIPYIVSNKFEGELSIFDLAGRQVYVKKLSHNHSGQYTFEWDGINQSGMAVPSGLYITRISSAETVTNSQKITLLK